ncbi:MAG TPA: T9SS type A sorting domain-containing protein [Candidatus Syntrophosphaera sp.]|jgi:hypothetical protein|nr:T9SS type A sorting domain-containing protein [Candidatus Syntrophosphaera sp.]
MKSLYCIKLMAVLLIGVVGLSAQAPSWVWAAGGGGADDDSGYAVATDSSGNIYATGKFQGTAMFGATTLTSAGGDEIFVAKLDAAGNWLWARRAGGLGHDYSYGLCVDGSGNAYISGYFRDTATFGALSLTASAFNDVFVAKLDPDGNWLWAVRAGSMADDYGAGICIGGDGNLRLTGSFNGYASFGATSFGPSGGKDVFVACLDSSGNWLWAKRAGGLNNDYGFALTCDPQGNTCVTGSFSGIAEFGATSLTGQGPYEIYVAKLDPDGNWLWAKRAGGEGSEEGLGVSTDSSGNIYLIGYFEGWTAFGTFPLVSYGSFDGFIAKLDAAGNWLWAKRAGGPADDIGYCLTTNANGISHITGYFEETAAFGSASLTSMGYDDIFAAGLDSNGNWLWAERAGGPESDFAFSISRDPEGNSYIIGNYKATAFFGPLTVTSSGFSDIFVAKLSPGVPADDDLVPDVASHSSLSEVWPNPIRPGETAIIKAFIDDRETGTLKIFNLRGQIISSQQLASGEHQISLSSSGLGTGIYLCQLRTPAQVITKKFVLY